MIKHQSYSVLFYFNLWHLIDIEILNKSLLINTKSKTTCLTTLTTYRYTPILINHQDKKTLFKLRLDQRWTHYCKFTFSISFFNFYLKIDKRELLLKLTTSRVALSVWPKITSELKCSIVNARKSWKKKNN